jgi:beta-lactamase superfamily II metal-dependent hydrolase
MGLHQGLLSVAPPVKSPLILPVILLLAALHTAADPLVIFFIDPTFDEYSGDAMLVCTPGGEHYLVDGGMFTDYPPAWDCGLERVLPLLDSLGVTYLDGMVATHPDADHIGGLISVLDSIPVGTVWDSGWPYSGTWTYQQFLSAVWSNGADYVTPRRGDLLDWGSELTVEVVHPVEPLDPASTNNASITFRLSYGDHSFMFTGDLEAEGGEDDILAALAAGTIDDVTSDVLKVGHHGSYTSTSDEWLDALNPSVACIEVGAGNPYGHPHWEVIARLQSRGITIYRTDLHGTFYLASDGDSLYYNSLPPSGEGGVETDRLIVYPSPVTSTATFAWDAGVSGGTIRVYNLLGEIVYESQAGGGSHTWDLHAPSGGYFVSPGLYLVRLEPEGGGQTWEEFFAVSR